MNDTNNSEPVLDPDDDMPEFDFSKGERGKFYRANAVHHIPIYLEQRVQAWLIKTAASKGVSAATLASELLGREMDKCAEINTTVEEHQSVK
jgi:hypothetical protein